MCRYRLRFRNATGDIHPIHLHRHTFEVTHRGAVGMGDACDAARRFGRDRLVAVAAAYREALAGYDAVG